VTRASGRIVWASPELAALCGRDSALGGASALELWARPERYTALRNRLAQGAPFARECLELVRSDGQKVEVDVSVAAVPRRWGEGLVLAIVRPRSEAGEPPAPDERDPYRAMLDSSPEAVLALDRRGCFTYANPALERLLGHSASDLLGLPVTVVFATRADVEGVADALSPSGHFRAELRLVGEDGGHRILSVAARRLCLADGTRTGTVAFLRDVTEQRRSEDALERKNQELEHYVQGVSHDLRTPLVSLLGFSRLLAQDYGEILSDTGRRFLERIEQAGRTMESLINDLLELSRIGQANGQRDLVDPLPILKQLVSELKPRLEARSVSLVLPESPPPIFCVPTQLYQVFSNLIGNALEHMGSPSDARIEVAIQEQSDAHVVVVRDNGVGIAREHHDRVFEIFQTLGPRSGGKGGTGIGLAIVKKVAESHRGRVWIESEPGRGTAFHVAFPRS
jgi:PAS domain S-box-containing protein